MAHEEAAAGGPSKLVIKNIGLILSGDLAGRFWTPMLSLRSTAASPQSAAPVTSTFPAPPRRLTQMAWRWRPG